jgi:DNA invertase Pin-like site-specific DNA recombinase
VAPQRLIAYERGSTARQGASGLGLEAQRQSIDAFAGSRGAEVLARFTEVESGRNPDRPELNRALHLSKITGATLVIAKPDLLSRNAAFHLTLRDSGVRFLAVDLPEANDLTVGIMALVAQAEREAISRRTKEALAVAKARGVKLGNPNGAQALRRAGKGAGALRAAVDLPIVRVCLGIALFWDTAQEMFGFAEVPSLWLALPPTAAFAVLVAVELLKPIWRHAVGMK